LRPLPALMVFAAVLSLHVHAQAPAESGGNRRPSVGLVLSGGGAKGFAYIGLLKVMQEAGLPVDYIGGSSIGSIIGGLYALGYHPDSIAKMVRSQNWDNLLKDVIDRRYIAYEEKEYGEKAIITLPIRNKKLSISSSMYHGQEINLLLNYYFSPGFKTKDFRKLQTPFLCIGTDILTGEAVVLDSGYLPMAIRSSMSIPGYFSPTFYNGRYLVDGGVVNNYPVEQVKHMGAEIIVGGDVQSGLADSIGKLSSLTAILDQVMSFSRVEANRIGDSLTDLKVAFRMEYGMMDFESYDSIIAFGERVARAHYPQIKALADSLNAIRFKPVGKYAARPIDTLYYDEVVVKGNKKMSATYVTSMFSKTHRGKIALKDLQDKIRVLYGTHFFETIGYQVETNGRKTTLVMNVKEAEPGYVSAGIHFDMDYNGSLVFSGAFRNVLGKRTKLFADLVLGINPRLRAMYLAHFGRKFGVGGSFQAYSFKFDLYDQKMKVNKIMFTNYQLAGFVDYTFNNVYNFRAGLEYEYFRFKEDIVTDSAIAEFGNFTSYGNLFATVQADTRDKNTFPTKGLEATMRIEYVVPFSNKDWVSDLFTNSTSIYLKFDQYIPLSRKFVLSPGLFAGAILRQEDVPPPQHWFGLGGLNPDNYVSTFVPFTGLEFVQRYGFYSAMARLKLQYNVFRKIYVTVRSDAGGAEVDFSSLFEPRNFLIGYGATAGYDSFIGPIEVSLMGSNLNSGVMLFVNLGFWF
jgi:NTE family protein